MRHLIYVIAFTGRFEHMRRFYERGLELPVRHEEPDWVEYDTAGASIALHRMENPRRQGILPRFATDDLDTALREFRERGLEMWGEVIEFRDSRIANFWDPDDNLIQLVQPGRPVPSGAAPPLENLILNVADMVKSTDFYRDRFGLTVLTQSPWRTEFETGATRLTLHPRVAATRELRHQAQRIVAGFEVPSLEELGRELAGRGLVFTGGPVDLRYGRFAEVTDPDGNVVLFRRSEPRSPLELRLADPEELAEEWEDDDPTRDAMRKPGTKRAKATSRVVVKPAYRAKKSRSAKSKHPAKSEAVRTNTRLKVKPATGRLKKAARKSAVRKKAADAAASRSRPVKRAAARRARPRGR